MIEGNISQFRLKNLDWIRHYFVEEITKMNRQIKSINKFVYIYIYMNYIIDCKIKKDNHQVPKMVRVPGNKTNPKRTK